MEIIIYKSGFIFFHDFLLQLVVCSLTQNSLHIIQYPGHCYLSDITVGVKSLHTYSLNACLPCEMVSSFFLAHST